MVRDTLAGHYNGSERRVKLEAAIRSGDIQAVREQIASGADINSRDQVKLYLQLLLLISVSACHHMPAGEQADAFLIDEAKLLNDEQSDRIQRYHDQLQKDLDIHFKVAILRDSPASIDEAALKLFQDYSLGSKTRGAKGLLLVIDPSGQQTRIEIGYDLESMFPDSFAGHIQREQMAPFL